MKRAFYFLLLICILFFGVLFQKFSSSRPVPAVITNTHESLSYEGKEGFSALTLLQKKAVVEQDANGLVVSINGKKADATKREYWAFYVNNKLAPVGPAEYATKDTDTIEWRVETY